MNIQNSLQTLGLSPKEAAVYAALLRVKKGTAMSVAEASGIKRPTAYAVLESLKNKKLVAATKFRNVLDYRALPLDHLKHFVREQKKAVEHGVGAIQKVYNNRPQKNRLRVYGNIGAVKVLLEKSLREKAQMRILGHEHAFASHLGEYWQFYIKRAGQLGITPEFKKNPSHVSLMLWSDKVAFVQWGDVPQVFGFKNKELSEMYKAKYLKL